MNVERITSIKDARVLEARTLSSISGRRQAQKCLLEDAQIITWALEAGVPIERVFFHEKLTEHPLLSQLQEHQIACYAVSDGILKKISDTRYLIPLLGVAPLPGDLDDQSRLHDFVLVLDDVRDFGNIGTIIRTARAFGLRDLLATTPDFDRWHRKTIEASRGQVFDVCLKRFTSAAEAITFLQQRGFQIVATSPYAPQLQSTVRLKPKPIALVVGNETDGISDTFLKHADVVVQIPMSTQVESLNVGVATGISVYELKLKLVLAMLTKYIRSTLGREMNVTGKMIQMALDHDLAAVTTLNSVQVILLMILKCDEIMTIEQVSKDTAMFGTELQEFLQPLFDQGYIRMHSGQNSTLCLTEQGEQFLGQIWGVVEHSEEHILQAFTLAEKQQLTAFLKRIQANCQAIISA
ncbi:MAG: RNA methyltransferase [Candidatus Vecturithrix sp.]|jgi:TrmH family RNA methyltransferase|nr:RNA methyltransferase [Candidatus Vecturithrix sp.]